MKRLVWVLALAGCVTTRLTTAGEQVRVTANPDVVSDCRYLGAVEGEDRMNGGFAGQGAAEENANRRLRNAAADLGGNVVLVVTSDVGPSGAIIRGEASTCCMRPAVLALALVGCNPFAPEVWYNWREPMDPPPAEWYADVEACWGVAGDFAAIRWYRGDLEHHDLGLTVGEIVQGDEITLQVGLAEHSERITKHAMSHHVRPDLGHRIHYGDGRAICDDA